MMKLNFLKKNFQQTAWESIPQITRRARINNFPKKIRNLVPEKQKLKRRWRQTRAPVDRTSLNNATHQLKREIQHADSQDICR